MKEAGERYGKEPKTGTNLVERASGGGRLILSEHSRFIEKFTQNRRIVTKKIKNSTRSFFVYIDYYFNIHHFFCYRLSLMQPAIERNSYTNNPNHG